MQDLQMDFEREEKSAFDFVHENYYITQVHDENSFVQCDVLFEQFCGWCEVTNAKSMKRLNFIGEIRKRFQVYGVRKVQIRWEGAKVYGFYGLKKRIGENTYVETRWNIKPPSLV
jgi:hypothetical protein